MKVGQLVMLVRRNVHPLHDLFSGKFPPIGASGEVIGLCGIQGSEGPGVHVDFPHYPCDQDGSWWHVPSSWLVPIDDPDAVKAADDQRELDLDVPKRVEERLAGLRRELADLGRKLLEEES